MLNINIPNEPNIFKVHMHEKVAKKWTTASWALVCNTHLFSCLATPWGFGPPFWSVLSSCLTSRKPGTWSHVLMWLSRSSLIASIPPRSARSGKCFYSLGKNYVHSVLIQSILSMSICFRLLHCFIHGNIYFLRLLIYIYIYWIKLWCSKIMWTMKFCKS